MSRKKAKREQQAPAAASNTLVMREALFHDRWSSFGSNTGITELSDRPTPDELRKYEIFEGLQDGFLEEISQDVSIARWAPGSVLFEEGSYIDVAFFLVEGEVDVFIAKHGGPEGGGGPIFDAGRTMMMQQPSAAGDDTVAQPGGGGSGRGQRGKRGGDGGGGGHRGRKAPADGAVGGGDETVMISQVRAQSDGDPTFLAVMDIDLPRGATVRLGAGEMFGEIGALSGWPQAVTARTAGACTLVQIRLPALRRLKEESPAFKERADRMYRERTLYFHLRRLPLLARCEEAVLDRLVEKVELVSLRPNKVLLEEGQPADALYVVRSGFLKLTQHFAAGEPAVSYLSKGMTLGEVEMMVDDIHGWTCTASSAGYCELVKIEKADVDAILQTHPETAQELWQSAVQRIKETGYAKRNLNHSELIEFSLKKGLVQGNSILVIDLNTCTRCDDCMRACADTHGGRPRFVREGERYGSHLIARSCYHCRDPHCLVGCPTGAIHRAAVGDVVEIQEDICIGCSNCANKCPYDAIIMHPTGETWPGNALPEFLRGTEQKVASKCDLCYTSADGPACVKNCPHGCAIRIGSVDEFTALSRASKNGN